MGGKIPGLGMTPLAFSSECIMLHAQPWPADNRLARLDNKLTGHPAAMQTLENSLGQYTPLGTREVLALETADGEGGTFNPSPSFFASDPLASQLFNLLIEARVRKVNQWVDCSHCTMHSQSFHS